MNDGFEKNKMADVMADEELGNKLLFMEGDEGLEIEENPYLGHPLVALQPIQSEEIIDDVKIEVIEEVIGESAIEVPPIAQEQEIPCNVSCSVTPTKDVSKKKKAKSSKQKTNKKLKLGTTNGEDDGTSEIDVPRKWERKKVQIKTLEGEFSVTVWASGRYICICIKYYKEKHAFI